MILCQERKDLVFGLLSSPASRNTVSTGTPCWARFKCPGPTHHRNVCGGNSLCPCPPASKVIAALALWHFLLPQGRGMDVDRSCKVDRVCLEEDSEPSWQKAIPSVSHAAGSPVAFKAMPRAEGSNTAPWFTPEKTSAWTQLPPQMQGWTQRPL